MNWFTTTFFFMTVSCPLFISERSRKEKAIAFIALAFFFQPFYS